MTALCQACAGLWGHGRESSQAPLLKKPPSSRPSTASGTASELRKAKVAEELKKERREDILGGGRRLGISRVA